MNKFQANLVSIKPYVTSKVGVNPWKRWKNGKNWILCEDLIVDYEDEKYSFRLIIKQGYITDGGSVPDAFRGIVEPHGKYLVAFFIHDALYSTELCKRSIADDLLCRLCGELGANWIVRNGIWTAVRIGGGFVWKEHTIRSIDVNKTYIEFTPIKGFDN